MSKVKLYVSNRQNKISVPNGLRTTIRKCCEEALKSEGFEGSAEISLTYVDNVQIREMNKEYRDKDAVTDVLSFPLGENGDYDVNPDTGCYMLGDIVISLERAEEQAKEYGHSFERETAFLATHSMFHLLGYDHENSAEEDELMRKKQSAVLEKLGICR